MKCAMLLFMALLATAPAGVAAQTGDAERVDRDGRTETFTDVDANRNGLLDRNEVKATDPGADFDEMDLDDDGAINRNEYFQYHRQ